MLEALQRTGGGLQQAKMEVRWEEMQWGSRTACGFWNMD